jgi:hypothetical protein
MYAFEYNLYMGDVLGLLDMCDTNSHYLPPGLGKEVIFFPVNKLHYPNN